jgi:hypothetical protein
LLQEDGTNFVTNGWNNNPGMVRNLLILFLSCLCTVTLCQTAPAVTVPHDTIFKINGSQLAVDVTTVTPTYVSFVFPGKPEEFTIERKEVHKIIYKTGKIDVLNQAAFQMFDETSWEAVWITEDKKEIGNLYMLGPVEANSPSSVRSPAAAKKSAIIKLKKKAANLKGTLILITEKKATGGYGEYPGYYIKGVAYGPNPPEQASTPAEKGSSVKDAGM